jgi:hypothetical protein
MEANFGMLGKGGCQEVLNEKAKEVCCADPPVAPVAPPAPGPIMEPVAPPTGSMMMRPKKRKHL